MGRFRLYEGEVVVVDVCSDLYRSKMLGADPLAICGTKRKQAFLSCMAKAFEQTVYVVDMGFGWRVSGISPKKLRLLLRGSAGRGFYLLK